MDSETLCDCDHRDTKSTRTQYCQTSPQTEPPRGCLLHGLGVWAGVPQFVVSNLPSPTPSSTSSDLLEPPSLESLTELESGYEASVSSALSSDTD